MSVILHLGVSDQPYANEPRPPGSKATSGTQTTGDVATWLEDKYHVMEIFFELHRQEIADLMAKSVSGGLENLLLGSAIGGDVFGDATNEMQEMFKRFLSEKQMDSLGYPGVPTKAALLGKSHRFKKKYSGPRPSFIDTGLYEASMKAWIDK